MELELEHRPELLLLDAGDTIIFLDPGAVAAALADQGLEVDAGAIGRALHPAKRRYQQHLTEGRGHEDGWSVLVGNMLEGAGVAPARIPELLPRLRAVHDDFYFWRSVPEGLVPAMERAKAGGIRLGIISNSEGRLSHVLERIGIRQHFEHVIDSHIEGVDKPDPAIFRLALERHGVAAERAVYAGDIPEVDVFGSQAVGMHGALIDAWNDHADRDDVPRFRSVEDLIDHLLTLPS